MYIIPFGPLQHRSQVPIYVNSLSTWLAWTDLLRWPLQLHRYHLSVSFYLHIFSIHSGNLSNTLSLIPYSEFCTLPQSSNNKDRLLHSLSPDPVFHL